MHPPEPSAPIGLTAAPIGPRTKPVLMGPSVGPSPCPVRGCHGKSRRSHRINSPLTGSAPA